MKAEKTAFNSQQNEENVYAMHTDTEEQFV